MCDDRTAAGCCRRVSHRACMLVPVVRFLALRYGLVDKPDGRRKVHGRPVPLGGGLAILASSRRRGRRRAGGPRSGAGRAGRDGGPRSSGLSLAAVLICAVGVADDCRVLRGRYKLLGQVAAVAIVIGSGVVVRDVHLFGCQIDLGLLSCPVHRVPAAGGDQLAELARRHGRAAWQRRGGRLPGAGGDGVPGGSLGGRRPGARPGRGAARLPALQSSARVHFHGRLRQYARRAWWWASWPSKARSRRRRPSPWPRRLVLLTLPIFDTTAAIIRRKLTGRSIYTTDRGHLHHCLLRRGFSTWRVLLLVSSLLPAHRRGRARQRGLQQRVDRPAHGRWPSSASSSSRGFSATPR